jgi:hypothetical protein
MSANENIPYKFVCEKCDYRCSKKSSWSQHTLTSKHIKANFGLMTANEKYACENCDVKFSHKSSYCRHKKKCQETKIDLYKSESNDKDLIMILVKQNSELLEVIKNGTNNTNNSHNKTFNLNMFLNETCKDAMNITDFVESIKFQLSDLEKVGDIGYVEGISNIITTNLKALDITQRPIHCTDKKREIVYIKEADKWEKEDEERKRLRKAIKNVADKNSRLLMKFREKYPDCNKSESKYSDKYNKLIVEAFGGQGDNDVDKEEKIIKNITKNVLIEK